MKILVTGSSGLVGAALRCRLQEDGHEVVRLVRREPRGPGERRWDPEHGELDDDALDVDAVVHLAGESIAQGRWNAEKKERILRSRVDGTRLLSEAIARAPSPPRVLVSASAIGVYGDTADRTADESAAPGAGFLADVCRQWEDATALAAESGTRVVNLRIGVVLAPHGGALKSMLPPFKLGVAGSLGSGRQWMSWIALDDLVDAIVFSLGCRTLSGPVNAVAPNPVTNAEFTRTLGRVLSRPTFLPLPAFAARLAFGEMADALLLASIRVVPRALLDAGFAFRHPVVGTALREMLAPPAKRTARPAATA